MNIEALGEFTSKAIIPPWFKWVALAIALVAVVVAVYAYGEKQYQRGLSLGEKTATTKWQSKDNTELIAANNEIIRLQKQANEDEALHQQRITKIVDYLQELNTHEKTKSDSVIRDLASGNAKLQYQLKQRAASATSSQTDTCGTGQVELGPASRDEETTGELPPEIGANLYAEADRADEIARQLTSCQEVVIEDRRVCGVKQGIQQE